MSEENKQSEDKKIDADKLQKDLEEAKVKCEEYLNGWKRERADFINYKKDEMERIGQLVKYANEEIILKILPILDNIYLAESHIPESFAKAGLSQEKSWIEGFNGIKKQLEDFLKKEGIEPVETANKDFDPTVMEAVDGEGEKVTEEVQRGYTMHGKLIRPAKVRVTK